MFHEGPPVSNQCTSISSGEYAPKIRCQLVEGHEGSHFARYKSDNSEPGSSAYWCDMTFPIHFIEDKKSDGHNKV